MSRPPPPGWLSRLDVIGGLALVVGRVSAAVAGLGPGVVGPEAAKQAGASKEEIAEALGYGRESDFEDLHEALDELDRQIEAQEDTGGIFETIATRFEELRTRIFN